MRLPIFLLLPCSAWAASLQPAALRCEYLENPLAVESAQPRLSWALETTAPGQSQQAWQIRVASSLEKLQRDRADLWDSGRVAGSLTSQVSYNGKALGSGQQVFWQVRIWNQKGEDSGWSPVGYWRTALNDPGNWKAEWISAQDNTPLPVDPESLHLPPAHSFRKEFQIAKPIRRATAYLSALGNAELQLNGQPVAQESFLPGWSDYRKRAYYRAFDVTPHLKAGSNAIGATLTGGWYSGYVGYGLFVGYGPHKTGRNFYGKTPALLAQVVVEFEDGTRKVVGTDKTWRVTDEGPVREADLLMGETYDATREIPGWDQPGFDDTKWSSVVPSDRNGSAKAPFYDNRGVREVELGFQKPARLQAYPGVPVKVTEEIPARAISEPVPGTYIVDFGVNFAGVIRLKAAAPAGQKVQLRYGEMLHPGGRLMTENLRRARATDFYTFKGSAGGEEWTPHFTYHGFRYCEITGLPAKPTLETLTGLALNSDTPLVSKFQCSDDIVNRFYQNVVRTQRANFLEVPTDCPQRDERLGWMGDAQIYARSASYNADVAAFFTKWLDDVEESQLSFGAYPDYAPYPMGHGEPGKNYGTAWMDAGIICPHTVWKVYGDTRILERHWDSMVRFMEFREATSPEYKGVSLGNPWGDWLNHNDPTPVELIDAAYFGNSARMMGEMAAALGKTDAAEHYQGLFQKIRASFAEHHLDKDGLMSTASQTACVLALDFGLLPAGNRGPVTDQLVRLLEANGNRMSTGFLGTKPLLSVLTRGGRHDLALRLFQSRDFPSWCYPVTNGATSIWERWDSFTMEDGFGRHNAAMNSFSHYSFGAVCEWMFQSLLGIDTDGPGFRNFVLKPGPYLGKNQLPVQPIQWVRGEYRAPSGLISVAWKLGAGAFQYEVQVPPNTTATLHLPATGSSGVQANGGSLFRTTGVTFEGMESGRAICTLQPGAYSFVSSLGE